MLNLICWGWSGIFRRFSKSLLQTIGKRWRPRGLGRTNFWRHFHDIRSWFGCWRGRVLGGDLVLGADVRLVCDLDAEGLAHAAGQPVVLVGVEAAADCVHPNILGVDL